MSTMLGDGTNGANGAPAGENKDGANNAAAGANGAAAGDGAGVAVSVEDQRKFLVEQGGKADELAKLSEADLKKAFDTAKTAADAANKPPADGKYEFKMPEGVELDGELGTELGSVAKELGLSQKNAQKIADLGAKLMQKRDGALRELITKTHGEWTEQTRNDPEVGGAKLQENLGLAKKVIAAVDTDGSLVKALNETGMGNHPGLVKAFVRIGKMISEDRLVLGKTGAQTDASPGTFSYPNSKHNA